FIEPWSHFGDDTHKALDIFKSTLLSRQVGNPNLMSQLLATGSAAEYATERETPVQSWALMYHHKVLAHGLHPVIEHLSRGSVTLGCSYQMKREVRLGFGLGDCFVDGDTCSVDDGSLVACVECKRTGTMPWISIMNEYSRCLPSGSHRTDIRLDENGDRTEPCQNVCSWRLTVADPLGQLVMYMVMSGCKFGMLTNSYRTFFVRLGNRPRAVYVTDAFYPEQDDTHCNPNGMALGHATLLFYAHALSEHVRGQPRKPFWNWFNCPNVQGADEDTRFDDMPQQDSDRSCNGPDDTPDIQDMYTQDVQALFGQRLNLVADDGSRAIKLDLGERYWTKHEGMDVLCSAGLGMGNVDVEGHRCFLKTVSLHAKSANRELLHEAQVYGELEHLQGGVLPKLVLHGQDAFFALRGVLTTQEGVALSAGGSKVAERISLSGGLATLTNKIEGALSALHTAGYLHGDVALRNIVINSSGDVKLIDLGRASKLLSPGEASDELKIVRETLVPQLKSIY
ncbi:Protein kinase, putative, partial [Hondaea fermentalgiana]